MRILITGATGFIGSRLLARLAVECEDLRILRRESSLLEYVKNIRFEDFVGDITNPDDVDRAVSGCDIVFHVAASVSYIPQEEKRQYEVNVFGTRNVVNACIKHKVKRLIHTSSVVAVGLKDNGKLSNEDTDYNLRHLNISYSLTKHLAEEEIRRGIEKGLDAVIVNPGAVFGPGDLRRFHGHLYGGKAWTRMFYVGGGIATVDVDDVVEGHIKAWKHGRKGERYLLVNENLTFKEISTVIGEKLNQSRPRYKIPTWFIHAMACFATALSYITRKKPFATVSMAKYTKLNLFFSNEKSKRELGLIYRPFKESIDNAVEWFLKKGYLGM